MLAAYLFGLHLVRTTDSKPMWFPRLTRQTVPDAPGFYFHGGLVTALATSSPELVTTITAIRRNALTLAVSNIFGTNCFNMLVIASADVGYPGGSIYHDITPIQMTWGLVSILMTAILLMGMVRRQRYGFGNIGFESALILTVYTMALIIVAVSG